MSRSYFISTPQYNAFSCVIDDESIGMGYGEMTYELAMLERERNEACRRYEPNRRTFRCRGRHVQLGRRVNQLPATVARI